MEDEDADDPEQEPQEDDVRGHVVDGQCETPDREHRAEVAKQEGEERPEGPAVGQVGADDPVGRRHGPEEDAQHRDDDGQDRREQDVLAPPVDHLARQDAADGEEEPGHGRRLQADRRTDDNVAEGAGDQEEVEIDEGQEDDAGAGRNQAMAQSPEGGPVVAHRHHGARIVLHPADEEGAGEDPDQGREPAPLDGDDRSDDRGGAGNRFELVTEQDVFAGGHELHAVHIHLGRRGPFFVGFDDFFVDVLGVETITDEGNCEAQKKNDNRVHDGRSFQQEKKTLPVIRTLYRFSSPPGAVQRSAKLPVKKVVWKVS
ncbi:MAG: hypothetical protein A4E73_03630 [Syntrophaceae bacterium PtaU1.Bin231]|nr:MAG: hypothetical protein A4E73_03630 [Syntrophaceae bacterium PtaU1.Bin231]